MNDNAIVPTWQGRQPPEVRFGRRLKKLREDRGYTQVEVAMAAPIDRSFLSDLERGVKEPGLKTLDCLATFFNVTIAELLDSI